MAHAPKSNLELKRITKSLKAKIQFRDEQIEKLISFFTYSSIFSAIVYGPESTGKKHVILNTIKLLCDSYVIIDSNDFSNIRFYILLYIVRIFYIC